MSSNHYFQITLNNIIQKKKILLIKLILEKNKLVKKINYCKI